MRREGVERVLKDINVTDVASGNARTERRQVPRNRWRVTAEKFRSADRQTAARDADLVAAQSQMVIIEKALERAFPEDERARRRIIDAAKERTPTTSTTVIRLPARQSLVPFRAHRSELDNDEARHEGRLRMKEQER